MSSISNLDPRLHFVVATAIVVRDRKFLILRRALHEKAFPGRWTVPGGKFVLSEYRTMPKTAHFGQWYNVADWVLRKEVKEEAGIEIGQPQYLCDLAFIRPAQNTGILSEARHRRPDGYPVVTLSFWAHYRKGTVKISKDFLEYAWVTATETKKYDLIEGIADEIKQVNKLLKK